MFRPQIQKTRILVILAAFNLLLFYGATQVKDDVLSRGYEEKIKAAEIMASALAELKNVRMGKGVFVDTENDPNETALVGQAFSLITTDEGLLHSKLSTLNPNFAAGIVDMFFELGLQSGDVVAVAITGYMPGGNIALYSACQSMGIHPVVITSVGASQWGATDPYFTWLDMESFLFEKGIIHSRSIAASLGGGGDRGKGLSPRGRELLWEAIYRNNLPLIQEDDLSGSINKRMELYQSQSEGGSLMAFVNIGGGAASIGPAINAKLIPSGVVQPYELVGLSGNSLIKNFAQLNIPLVQILNIKDVTEKLSLPFAPIPTPEIGEGKLFSETRYNLLIVTITLILSAGVVIGLGLYSHFQIKERMHSYEPESIL